jgi:tetratricopeptide (TPR) repeat protein
MKPLTLDELWEILPPHEELRPVLDFLLSRSVPDPGRSWTASGDLATVGDRQIQGDALAEGADDLAEEFHHHLVRLYGIVASALAHLAAGQPDQAGRAFLQLAELEESRDRPDRAEAWARAAHRVVRDERGGTVAAQALRRWGRAARRRGRLDEALLRYAEGFEISEALGDARAAAEAAIGAGNVLEEQGRWREAEGWYGRALTALDRDGQEPLPERWHALLNLHIVRRSQGRLEESRAPLEAAERVAGDDEGAVVFLLNARGQLAQVQGQAESAEAHFRTALAAADGAGARVVVGLNLAECLLAQGRLLDAAETARRAELDAVTSGQIPRLPEVYRILGRIAATGDNPDAFVLFERALEIIRERDLPALERARTLQAYAEAEARRGETGAAQELRGQAVHLYHALGIKNARHPWSEYFGPEANRDTPDPSERDLADHD